jgi:hypothetical protein
MSRRGNDNSVLLSDIEDSVRRVLSQAQIKTIPLTDEEFEEHFKKIEKWVHQLTPQGVRELSLKLAVETAVRGQEYNGGFDHDDILETARKFAEFIHGDAPDGGEE